MRPFDCSPDAPSAAPIAALPAELVLSEEFPDVLDGFSSGEQGGKCSSAILSGSTSRLPIRYHPPPSSSE